MDRSTKARGLLGFTLWVLFVVGIAVGGVLLARYGSTAARLFGLFGILFGVFSVWLLWTPQIAAIRVSRRAQATGTFIAVGGSFALPWSRALALFLLGTVLGMTTPPLVKYSWQIWTGLRSRKLGLGG
jgi:hypothetical protein